MTANLYMVAMRFPGGTMYSSFHRADASIRDDIAREEYGDALDKIRDFVVAVMHEQSTPGEVVGSAKIDEWCRLVGEGYASLRGWNKTLNKTFKPNRNRIVILCTGLYQYGGTSLLIGDLVRAHPGAECTVIATNYLNDMNGNDLALSRVGEAECSVEVLKAARSDLKLTMLIGRLAELQPSRIFLLNHHQDSIIISAVEPFTKRTNVVFYHHADYNICLGVHMQDVVHVDPHNVGYFNCRNKEYIKGNVYVPMMVADRRVNRTDEEFLKNGDFRTCSSGSFHKFRNFYLYPYVNLIADRLSVREGNHYHVGHISAPDLAHVHETLSRRGIPHHRFVHIPWTADLWSLAVEEKIDLFIGSFPIGGARTTIEMMGAGIPHLMPKSYLSRFFSSRDIVYQDAFAWQYPSEFIEVIRMIDAAALKKHSLRSRSHYLLHYCTEALDIEERLNRICKGLPVSEPYALYPHEPDHLDRALHFAHLEYLASARAAEAAVSGRPLQPSVSQFEPAKRKRGFESMVKGLRSSFGF